MATVPVAAVGVVCGMYQTEGDRSFAYAHHHGESDIWHGVRAPPSVFDAGAWDASATEFADAVR